MEPQRIIKYFKNDYRGSIAKSIEDKKMQKRGYVVESEEVVKQFNGGKAFCLGCVFLPLALFGSSKKLKVTYVKSA